jgi:hypothetical protein
MEKIRINGSICLTELIEKAKQQHSAFSKAQNGKIYVNFTGWVNDNKDHYQDFSIQLNSTKEKSEAEGKVYFGNGRIKPNQAAPDTTASVASASILDEINDLPF